jgi:hypothetical protein
VSCTHTPLAPSIPFGLISLSSPQIIKLADKLYNLRSLQQELPVGWSVARAQAYFGWSSEVVAGCRAANAGLAKALDDIFKGTLSSGEPCVAPGYQSGDWRRDTPTADVA